jgi:hypothetical protein
VINQLTLNFKILVTYLALICISFSVIKEQPYVVKESGYAGFNLLIDIYFKNKDEPKKFKHNYDLNLQSSGPPITKTLREKYVFTNPAGDFRKKLLKGGGVSDHPVSVRFLFFSLSN